MGLFGPRVLSKWVVRPISCHYGLLGIHWPLPAAFCQIIVLLEPLTEESNSLVQPCLGIVTQILHHLKTFLEFSGSVRAVRKRSKQQSDPMIR